MTPKVQQPAPPEAATRTEILAKLDTLPPEQAAKIAARLRPMPSGPEPSAVQAPPPRYLSWEDYLTGTTVQERRHWCARKAKKANRPRLMSGRPERRITTEDVWQVLEAAHGRCVFCGSLAVEHRPSGPDGSPRPWEQVGRRIGSLGHVVARFDGGTNDPENLAWSCLWCNTWGPSAAGAADHGAVP